MPSDVSQVPAEQQHLLSHWDSLDEQARTQLSSQIENIDFELMSQLFSGKEKATDWAELASRAEPPAAFRLNSDNNRFSVEQAIAAGEEALEAGQLGAIVVAGGQGSRLGFEHPKGMYEIGPISNRTLFQFHIEQIQAIARRYSVSIPLYLMTSPATHQETVDFLQANNRFGLPEADLHIFCQGTMPAVDAKSGKLLLQEPNKIFESPNGHGGTLAALVDNGCLDDMKSRGITELFYFQVDNPIVEICQPELLGYHLLSQSEMTTQVVGKEDPMEKVGNIVAIDGKMTVIEYSDLPADQADRRDADNNPVFWAGNLAVHVFSTEFLRRASVDASALPFHRAHKKVAFVDETGNTVSPNEPNAIKFEKFIFDLMPAAKNPIAVEADASLVFAPLKNASGAPKDTPESTRAAISAKHRKMLEEAGATVKSDVQVEISPLFALDATELKEKITDSLFVSNDHYFEG